MRREIRTEIEIDAPAAIVWVVVTDIDAYADWNPLITQSSGVVEVGRYLLNQREVPGDKPRTNAVQVSVVEEWRVFETVGRIAGMARVLQGRHRIELEATAEGTRLTHTEVFTGFLTRLVMRESVRVRVEEGFGAMNEALKARAETLVAGGT